MPYAFQSSAKYDWRELVKLDPSIATYRRCTSEDMRKLAILSGWDYMRVKRAFNLNLFKRTKYLTLTLDPAFEPKDEVRERAKLLLAKRHRKKEHLRAVRDSLRRKELKKSMVPQSVKEPTRLTGKRVILANIGRYKF